MKTINVFMDDMRSPTADNEKLFPPDPYWTITRTIEDTKTLLSAGIVNDLSLDHDMSVKKEDETGYDLVKWMERNNIWPQGNIFVHSANTCGRENMLAVINRRTN